MTVSRKQMKLVRLMAMCVMSLLLFGRMWSKGKADDESFEKPSPATDMRALHRDGKLTISWSYARQDKIIIKGFYVERAEGNKPFVTLTFLKGDATQFVDDHLRSGRSTVIG